MWKGKRENEEGEKREWKGKRENEVGREGRKKELWGEERVVIVQYHVNLLISVIWV